MASNSARTIAQELRRSFHKPLPHDPDAVKLLGDLHTILDRSKAITIKKTASELQQLFREELDLALQEERLKEPESRLQRIQKNRTAHEQAWSMFGLNVMIAMHHDRTQVRKVQFLIHLFRQSKLSQEELNQLQKDTHFDKKELQQWYKGEYSPSNTSISQTDPSSFGP